MIVLIGMETSGTFRRMFADRGHHATSVDLLPADDGAGYCAKAGGHIQDDLFSALEWLAKMGKWPDVGIFHPSCTYLTVSAAWAFSDPDYERWPGVGYPQRVSPETLTGAARREAKKAALAQVRQIMALPINRKVIENPIGAISTEIMEPTQIVQPYQFGDDASKATCFWFLDEKGGHAPEMMIRPTNRIRGRMVEWPAGSGKMVERWANQIDGGSNKLTPGPLRWKERSKTFPGIASAIVERIESLGPSRLLM